MRSLSGRARRAARPFAWLGAAAILLALAPGGAPGRAEPPRLALLVGCTEYPGHERLKPLAGPVNDVALWAGLLQAPDGFGFAADDIIQLAAWPAEPTRRPTLANIRAAFQQLVNRAEPGSVVVVVLSGHGARVPLPAAQRDPLDPANPEPDGFDEVFLPADVGGWTDAGLTNALRDDEIGAWLQALAARGAHVWAVFDCCHSGTLSRGAPAAREAPREVSAIDLGAPAAALQEAARRAAEAAAKASSRPAPDEGWLPAAPITRGGPDPPSNQPPSGAAPGSVVAFFAAQSDETAPDLFFPADAEDIPANRHGLLSWTLVSLLREAGGALTYGDLQRLMAARYRAERGARPPTPFAQGDLARVVLGKGEARPAAISVARRGDTLHLTAGALQGLSPGAVLAVYPPPGGPADQANTVLGHLRVERVAALTAVAAPARRAAAGNAGEEWISDPDLATSIPRGARCEIVSRELGDPRLKLFVPDEHRGALERLSPEARALVSAADQASARWFLWPAEAARATPPQAAKPELWLLAEPPAADGAPPKIHARYPLGDEAGLRAAWERDLPKVYRWDNLWRVAALVEDAPARRAEVSLEAQKLPNESAAAGEPFFGGVLRDGQEMLFTARNATTEDHWVNILYLDANLGVRVLFSELLRAGESKPAIRSQMTVEGDSWGREGLALVALPRDAVGGPPNLAPLEQSPLGAAETARRGAAPLRALGPLGRLLETGLFQPRGRGGWSPGGEPIQPRVRLLCWDLRP